MIHHTTDGIELEPFSVTVVSFRRVLPPEGNRKDHIVQFYSDRGLRSVTLAELRVL